ncbi:MAG TPA: 2-oxoacid:acceptor oxidoreductase subunit alpha [Planctomycetota bacterium]|nr:2-oxoacid:acceptor oxidoreductase subunit alpha [Planctomycetota bacterium]
MDTNIRICGEAGQGVQTTGDLLTHALAAAGLHVCATQGYMSRIRGGVNSFDVRIGDAEVLGARVPAELLVVFTREALDNCRSSVAEGGLVLFDGQADDGVIALEMAKAAAAAGGSALMANAVAAGAVYALLGLDLGSLRAALSKQFAKKDESVARTNIACAEKGAELVAARRGAVKCPKPGQPFGAVVSGSETVGLAAAVAGVKVVSSYPMTPSTGVFTWLAGAADRYGIVVEQAEDEIAAINMVCGATYAGVPAMTTTSGGGFALMAEGLSLAGMCELPAVILLSQRPAPATGLPTRTGQEDLLFAAHAGHGEFPRAIFAPGSLAQAYDLTRRAFETAHRWQTPAMILIDQFLADLQRNVAPMDETLRPIDRGLLDVPPADYRRYAVTKNGVSPRAIPGAGPFVITDSDEHTADGHLTEDLAVRVEQQDKRLRKCKGMLAEFLLPEFYPAPAAEVLACWGSTWGPCREAVDLLRAAGRDVCMLHFGQVWPIDGRRVKPMVAGRKVTMVEGNATAQLGSVLKGAGALGRFKAILRYDGLPFTGPEIAERAAGRVKS